MTSLAKLYNFATQCASPKEQPYTHTSLDPHGRFYFGEDERDKFYDLYQTAVKKGHVPSILERPSVYGPLRVDVDIKSDAKSDTKHLYSTASIAKLIKIYQDELRNIIDPDVFEEKMLWCVVLEKSSFRKDGDGYKDGFHLHFPNFICVDWVQDQHLRDVASKKIEITGATIDTNMAKKTWLMYGSSKAKGAEPYLVTKAADHKLKKIKLDKLFDCENAVDQLPRLLSIRGYVETTPIVIERPVKEKKKVVVQRDTKEILKTLEMIVENEMMGMLSDERANNHDDWMNVGWTLYNIGFGCDEFLDLWTTFSKRCAWKFVDGECQDKWSDMKMGNKTLGSLFYMIKQDAPEKYTELMQKIHPKLKTMKPTIYDPAEPYYIGDFIEEFSFRKFNEPKEVVHEMLVAKLRKCAASVLAPTISVIKEDATNSFKFRPQNLTRDYPGRYVTYVSTVNKLVKNVVTTIEQEEKMHIFDPLYCDNRLMFHTITRVCVVLQSEKNQIGKSIVSDFLTSRIFGSPLSSTISNISVITGKFNGALGGKLFINLDETKDAKKADWSSTWNIMKELITGKTNNIEKKGFEVTEVMSCVNFLVTTNEPKPIRSTEGRFALFRCNPVYEGRFNYFIDLWNKIDTAECGDNFLTYLHNYEPCNVKLLPDTDFAREFATNNKPKHELFMDDVISGDVEIEYDVPDDKFISTKSLYQSYVLWCRENNYNILNCLIFGQKIGTLGYESTRKRFQQKQLRGYTILISDGTSDIGEEKNS